MEGMISLPENPLIKRFSILKAKPSSHTESTFGGPEGI